MVATIKTCLAKIMLHISLRNILIFGALTCVASVLSSLNHFKGTSAETKELAIEVLIEALYAMVFISLGYLLPVIILRLIKRKTAYPKKESLIVCWYLLFIPPMTCFIIDFGQIYREGCFYVLPIFCIMFSLLNYKILTGEREVKSILRNLWN